MNISSESCPVCDNKEVENIGFYNGKSKLFLNKYLNSCKNCTAIYISPMLVQQELDLYYKSYWDLDIQSNTESARKCYFAEAQIRMEYIIGNVGSLKNKSIIDIGAGHGFIFDILKERYSSDFSYTAIETDLVQQNYLKQKGIQSVMSNWDNLIGKKPYDLIILSHILEHLGEPGKFLLDVIKILKQDGLIYIEVPNKDHLHKEILEPHLVVYNMTALCELFRITGFDILDIRSCGRLLQDIIPQKSKQTIKLFIKKLIPNLILNVIRKILNKEDVDYIEYYKLRICGDDRQWIRALVKRA